MKNGDKNDYIRLYSVAMEEVRHHHRVYTQTWIAGIPITGVFFSALYFLSREEVLRTRPIMWFAIFFGSLVMVTFYWVTMQRGMIAEHCREIAKKLEDILAGKKEDNDLFLTQEVEALLKRKWHVLWRTICRVWIIILIPLLVFWVYLCCLLLSP